MKKRTLIKILNSFKGNPDILFWNPLVKDWQHIHINPKPVTFYKESEEFIYNHMYFDKQKLNRSFEPLSEEEDNIIRAKAREEFTKRSWGLPNLFVPAEEYSTWYGNNSKQVILLDSKPRNKYWFDGHGNIEY